MPGDAPAKLYGPKNGVLESNEDLPGSQHDRETGQTNFTNPCIPCSHRRREKDGAFRKSWGQRLDKPPHLILKDNRKLDSGLRAECPTQRSHLDLTTLVSRKQHDRWVSLVYPNGHARTIRRTEAQQLLQEGAVEYGGEKDGRTCVLIKRAYLWRKTTRIVMAEKVGLTQMSLVPQ